MLTPMSHEHFDVLIVGAGLSGIGAACHLKAKCPGKTFVILEGRDRMGGTWDLFRYPGIRSDSDMFTLGYAFKPWTEPKAIADGPSILKYIREAAAENGLEDKIRYDSMVKRASWSSEDARWTVEVEDGKGGSGRYTCGFLFMCSGYYNYEAGYTPEFPGRELFKGRIVHPQLWTEDIDYAGMRVVVIGSGATAVTLVPALAEKAAHVTMLQRSPTYVVARPAEDERANRWRKRFPAKLAYRMVRWKNVLWGMYVYRLSKRQPEKMKAFIINAARAALGPDYDVKTHFTPKYNPWDQRLCLVPDGDLFEAIRGKKASVVTDTIETFTKTGIRLASGAELPADLIVTATGLDLLVLGGVALSVDGKPVEPAQCMTYKGMMYSGVPNMAVATGYTNASWTLKCDLTCDYVCRLLNHMDRRGFKQCTPRRDHTVDEVPWVDFSSGYVQRALHKFPKQGARRPWRLHQNYARDLIALRFGSLEDPAIEYVAKGARAHRGDARQTRPEPQSVTGGAA
jgi:cation diffusion facilitator CzcD-associated flavoprotein CzcO